MRLRTKKSASESGCVSTEFLFSFAVFKITGPKLGHYNCKREIVGTWSVENSVDTDGE